jgi:DNA-directed RNA polymerase specialized sigma subunit
MWDSIVINIVLSLAIIIISHQVWDHLRNTYSTKKQKNIAEFQTNKYKVIIEELRENRVKEPEEDDLAAFLSQEEKHWMAKELAAYITK